jgi:hypothetical protein
MHARAFLGLIGGEALAVLLVAGCSVPSAPIRAGGAETEQGPDRTYFVDAAERAEALSRAHVWRAPSTPISSAYLGQDASTPRHIDCSFKLKPPSGTTPKFDCVTGDGEEIRVKYGIGAELHAEAAATRLLRALGFGADTVVLVEYLRCFGCPKEPFTTARIVSAMHAENLYARITDEQADEVFPWVAVERRSPFPAIEVADGTTGWAFYELDDVDAAKGGAPRAHIDALRLLAVFLAHWDNKSDNQRLVCLTKDWVAGTPCSSPFLLLHDLGSTFGPRKVDLSDWERAGIWSDRASCTISMRDLPARGATFGSARVGEEGRIFLSRLLASLTDNQLVDLFSGARFDQRRGPLTPQWAAEDWARVFKARLDAIAQGPACPPV